MDSTGPAYRRRRVLVNPPLQFAFVKAMLIVLGVMALAALAAVYVAIRVTLSTFELANDPVIVSLFRSAFWLIMLELLVLTPLVVWLGILLTHKVAGPLVRIFAVLDQMSRGRYDVRITLRKGDMLVELAEAVNRLSENIRSQLKS